MNPLKLTPVLLLMTSVSAAGPAVEWNELVVFNEAPLETKLATFSDSLSPDLLVLVLWNDGNDNRLEAINIPPPYNGSGITTTALETEGGLFALGTPCVEGTHVVVPYIKDFNVEVSRFNGNTWTQTTLTDTITNNFDNTQCGLTEDGMFIMTHDLTDSETEFFRSNNAGGTYTFYGRYTSSGPFDGAIREPLAANFSDRHLMTISQQPNGQVRSTQFSTATATPNFNHTGLENLTPPNGFTFVKESAGVAVNDRFIFTYNASGQATFFDIPFNTPANHTSGTMGPVNSTGSQYTFQGGSILGVQNANFRTTQVMAEWDEFYESGNVNQPIEFTVDNDYPLSGVGGPIDGCFVHLKRGEQLVGAQGFFVGPRVGPEGTSLYIRDIQADPIFTDGFESGDTSSWQFSCQ